MAGNFNTAKLKQVMPKYNQSISCPTRGPNILDHCYTTSKDAYRSIPCPHFGIFLLPAYRQKLKRENPSRKEVQCWSEAAEDHLWECLESVHWIMLKCSVENLDKYATIFMDFISKCVGDCLPKKSFPNASIAVMPALTAPNTPVPSTTAVGVRLVFPGVNPRKAMSPDGVSGRALRSCVDQLVEVFSDIFNLSLLQAKVPTCFKKTTITAAPKKTHAVYINDYCTVALTSIIMKRFDRLVMAHVNSSLPVCLNPLQFAYQHNSPTFNTIIPSRVISKLHPLQLDPQLSDPQARISKDSKTEELIIDFRKKGGEHSPIYINGTVVERVNSIKFLGMIITDNLSWTSHGHISLSIYITATNGDQHLWPIILPLQPLCDIFDPSP
eukprot:g33944.t1